MEHQKILNLLNEASDSEFATRKWNIVNNNWKAYYGVQNEIKFNTEVLKPNLCDYDDAKVLVRSDITVTAAPATQVAFKNCAPFTKCMDVNFDGTTIDDAENLDLTLTMYNSIEYSSNYSW